MSTKQNSTLNSRELSLDIQETKTTISLHSGYVIPDQGLSVNIQNGNYHYTLKVKNVEDKREANPLRNFTKVLKPIKTKVRLFLTLISIGKVAKFVWEILSESQSTQDFRRMKITKFSLPV